MYSECTVFNAMLSTMFCKLSCSSVAGNGVGRIQHVFMTEHGDAPKLEA